MLGQSRNFLCDLCALCGKDPLPNPSPDCNGSLFAKRCLQFLHNLIYNAASPLAIAVWGKRTGRRSGLELSNPPTPAASRHAVAAPHARHPLMAVPALGTRDPPLCARAFHPPPLQGGARGGTPDRGLATLFYRTADSKLCGLSSSHSPAVSGRLSLRFIPLIPLLHEEQTMARHRKLAQPLRAAPPGTRATLQIAASATSRSKTAACWRW